jgi:DNA-binding GntR family transcriptional regulator
VTSSGALAAGSGKAGVRRQSLRDQAGRVLRAQVIAGELQAGTLYPLGQIAEGLQISVTPVREALLDMVADGLVEMVPNRGFRVRLLTEQDLDEIVELRLLIEPPAVRQITERHLVDDFTALRDLAARTETAAREGDWVAFLDTDRDMHLELLGYLGNSRLTDIAGKLRDQARLYGLDRVAGTHEFFETTHEHVALLDAVEAGDADEAEKLTSRHLNHARGVWAGRR